MTISIREYGESLVVRGNTKKYKKYLKSNGGRWDTCLTGGPGWIFPKNKFKDLEMLKDSIDASRWTELK
jgi:hypothetical protein